MNEAREGCVRALELLHASPHGRVYRAERLELGLWRPRLLRLVSPAAHGHAAILRLRDEARLLGLLHHAAIAAPVALLPLRGELALLAPRAEDLSLRDALEAGPIPPRAAAQVVAALASALRAAATTLGPSGQPLQVVHRAIATEHVRVDLGGGVQLTGWGAALARLAFRGDATDEAPPVSARPPEFHAGAPLSARADVWALGALWVAMLRGAPLPPGEATDGLAASLGASLGLEGVTLLDAMLRASPADRPTITSVADAMGRVVEQVDGEDLSAWARRLVPALLATRPAPLRDAWCGPMLDLGGRLGEAHSEGPAPADEDLAAPAVSAAPPPPQLNELFTHLATPAPPPPDAGQLLMFSVPAAPDPPPPAAPSASVALASQLAATAPGREVTAEAQRQLSRLWYLVAGLPLGAIALSLLLFVMQNPAMLGLITTWMRSTGVATLLHATGEDCVCPPDAAP